MTEKIKLKPGDRFYHLTVIKKDETKSNNVWFICKCDCGRERSICKYELLSGRSRDCYNIKECIYAYQHKHDIATKGNIYDLSGDYGIGYIHKTNQPFYFDKEDYDKVKDYSWYADPQGYIRTNTYDFNTKKRGYIFLHNLIMNADKNIRIDHIGGNQTVHDNRKSNLRVCTISQNNMNQDLRKDNTSGTRGVNYHKGHRKWTARIQIDNQRILLGEFETVEEAIQVRKEAEKQYFGEFAFDKSQEKRQENETLYGYRKS